MGFGAPLAFVRTFDNTNLAVDETGWNFILLTSPDAAALCALAYGRKQVRALKPSELLAMAEGLGSEHGFALTLGPNRAEGAGQGTNPAWNTLRVTAHWFSSALRLGGSASGS